MGFAVFIHRSDSIYDDSPAERYQFPKTYLGRAQASVGDWIVYLEPRAVRKTRGYFAIAKVKMIIPDPKANGMFIAVIEPGSYLEFSSPVPFSANGDLVERGLLNSSGKISGWAQSAVRPLSAADFGRITSLGLKDDEPVLPRSEEGHVADGFAEQQAPFVFDEPRERISQMTSRAVRDRVFRKVVLRAYDQRCAITGRRFINGGGRAEVTAAHIRPVAKDGPDTVNNGLALSGTAHWMFDRGLISLGDGLEILISRQVNNFEEVRSFIRPEAIALCPSELRDRPHPRFLEWHRQNCFKE
jgi:putative restriction endonuclease